VLELKASKPVVAAVQLGTVWVVGAVAPPIVLRALLIAAFAGATGWFVVVALVGMLATLAYLIVVITVTREVSVLGAGGGRRVLWALLVMSVGTVGWALGWAVTDVARLGVGRQWPWVLVRRWR
jgi:hypothetical protein